MDTREIAKTLFDMAFDFPWWDTEDAFVDETIANMENVLNQIKLTDLYHALEAIAKKSSN